MNISLSEHLENVDYVLSHSSVIAFGHLPTPINVTLLNDGIVGEDPETITLTLVHKATVLEPNVIVSNEAITITVHDNNGIYILGCIFNMIPGRMMCEWSMLIWPYSIHNGIDGCLHS